MQKDSMHFSASGHVTHDQAVTQESLIKSFQCSHCTLIFKSKVSLFEHLNQAHSLNVDAALRAAGLKNPGTNKASTDNNRNSSGDAFECQHCDFKACVQDVLNEHDKQCQNKSENHTSEAKCILKSSKDLKTYNRSLQTITKYFATSSGSNGKTPLKLADGSMFLDGTKETLILKESPSDSSANSSGVFKVTAQPTIDISKPTCDLYLLDDHLVNTELRPPKSKEKIKETVPKNVGKRTSDESSKSPPAKKAKSDKEKTKLQEKANASKQESSNNMEFSLEFSEDEEEKKVNLVNGSTESPDVYVCKHCDYSHMSIRSVSNHYQNDHPYILYNAEYIQDPSDQSATFRCLECPVEFLSVTDLKRHYMENHPEAPDVFTVQSCELCLVFKCFVCPFTTNASKALKEHYRDEHPTHKVDNSLMYHRYLATRRPERPSRLNMCEKAPSPERLQEISHESACTPSKEVSNAPSPQHPTSKCADVALYHCNYCKFNHKSIVVMHVHYQKSHPDEAVTMDKIKQAAHVTLHTTLQMTPDRSPNSQIMEKSTPQKNISDSSMEKRDELSHKKGVSLSLTNPEHTPGASETHSESAKTKKVEFAEDRSKRKKLPTKRYREMSTGMDSLSCSSPDALFYCQLCSYSSTKIKSVIGHHNAKHAAYAVTGTEEILWYSAEVQKKKLQSKAKASAPTSSSVSKTNKQVEACSEKEPQHEEDEARDASEMEYNVYACAENLFYCQKCNYGNTSVQRVLNHQAKVHHSINSNMDRVIEHTALIRDEIEKSKSQAKKFPFSTHLPLPIINEGDENAFFCHFCNYRHRTLSQVLKHYLKKHRGFVAKGQQVRLYTSMVLTQTQKSHLKTTASQEVNHASLDKKGAKKKKTKKLGKVSALPSLRALQTQRTLQCHRCQYSTQYVYLLKRHMLKTHKAKRSVTDVLRMCFNQGTLQIGYHCDLCVFSHKKASAVYIHYQEQHPGRRPSLQYVTNRLYVGPETPPPTKKKPQTKHTDGIDGTDGTLPHQRSGQNETKIYPCRACSFKGSSASSIVSHYHAVHPWTVKEDGSVLDVINSKRWSANRQVEGHHEMPVPFDYSPGSSHEKAASSRRHKCPHCPARFLTHRGLKTHCGMKHQEAVDESQGKQVPIQTRVHVFKCPHCPYFNTSYHGVLTHCQMRHPALPSRADSLHIDEVHFHNWEHCLKRARPDLRLTGYMCKTCPKMYKTLEKLNKHCEKVHNETVANTAANLSKSAPDPLAVSNKTHSSRGSVSKASFLRKKMYPLIKCQYCTYNCTTKLALGRHLHVHHKNASQDCLYKCELCSSSFFRKALLRSHYAKKHGEEAFLNCCEPPHKQVHEKLAPTVPDCLLTQQPEEASNSSTTAEENKILVYKCPSCPYVNASYHGTLTHCQMKHPDVRARADELKTDEIFVTNMVGCTIGKGYNERGYMCKKCPQIHVSLKKLKVHSERDHDQPEATASEHSFESETEKQLDHGCRESVLEEETNTASVQQKESLYKCHICTYMGSRRRYLHCHYKNTHKFDAFTTYKLLEKYNKCKRKKLSNLPEAESEESVHVKCKMCPDLKFDSSQLLIAHYSTFHSSDRILDFVVLSQASKKSTGLYKCALCKKQMNGIRRLCLHLDSHREMENKMAEAAKTKVSPVITATPEAKSIELRGQDDLPMLESVEELAQWNVTPVETFALPSSPLLSPSKPNDPEQPELEDEHTCKQCGRTFMSLKGLRSHERSHAALAAIKKKLGKLSTSALKHNNINKYIIYKAGTMRPFLCSFCSYRTTVMGLWRCHFLKAHQDVIMNPAETDNQDEESAQRANKEPLNPSEELMNLSELDEEPEITEKLLYLEPPDVQRQLNHYSLMAGAPSKAIMKETKLPENNLFHCEVCNFHTGHLSSMRRHYLNRHGKKILRCKDCSFFTGVRKTLEMHMETGHSTCQSGHQKDLHCPFCLYQTKNKNNMIDHIVLHREERVVPIEVRRPKLSRYLRGIVFRCHKCTFSSGSAENLRLHMTRHNDIKPYKCRLCYFDCTRLSDLEAHLSDKHQVVRNHELVGQISLDQLEARLSGMPQEGVELSSNLEQLNIDNEDVKTEEFVTDCDEVPPDTQAQNPAENNIRDNITLKIKEAYQKKGQYSKNGNEENDAKCSTLDLECKNTKPNNTVQEKQEQDPQEQVEIVFLPDAARGQGIKNIVEQNVAEGNNADIQCEDCSCPEKETQVNENQALVKLNEDSSVMFTQQKQEAAEGSSATYGKIAERAQVHKLHIKALKHRAVNIEARVEDDLLHQIVLLDEDGSLRKIHKKTDQDRTIKTEQNTEPEVNVLSEIRPLNKDGSITLAHGRKKQVSMKAISTSAKTSHMQANNIRARERFTVERSLLTLPPSCRQLKRSHEEMLDVSFPNCKEEQLQNSEEVRDPYGEMPVLENVYLKEEMNPLGCCKEEDDNDHLAPKQDKEDEMVTDEDENRGTNWEHQELDRIKEADNPHVPKGALTVTDGAAEVLCPAATEEKPFTCRFCGRNLKNSSELERHVMRHGI